MFYKLNSLTRSQQCVIAGAGLSTLMIGNYLNYRFLKKRKGIRKLAQVYLRDSVGKDSIVRKRQLRNQIEIGEEMQLYHASMLSYFRLYFYTPHAIIFPKRLESLQKILKIANKYNIGVLQDLNDLNDFQIEPPHESIINQNEREYIDFFQERPFVVINQKHIDSMSFNENDLTCKVGVGCTVNQVNDFLRVKGYELPIVGSGEAKLFTLLNQNRIVLEGPHKNMGELTQALTVVLPDGKALLTTPNEQKQPFSAGMDFQHLFIGQQANNGLLVDATLKVHPISEYHLSHLSMNTDHVTQTNLYYVMRGIRDALTATQFRQFRLQYDQRSHELKLAVKSTNKIDLAELLDRCVNPYVYREMWRGEVSKKSEEPLEHKYILQFALDPSSLLKCLLNIHMLPNVNLLEQMSIDLDLCHNVLTVGIDSKQENLNNFRTISSYVRQQNGRFIGCNNTQIQDLLTQEALPEECGLNHVFLAHQLKRQLDPKNILIGGAFTNRDTMPTFR